SRLSCTRSPRKSNPGEHGPQAIHRPALGSRRKGTVDRMCMTVAEGLGTNEPSRATSFLRKRSVSNARPRLDGWAWLLGVGIETPGTRSTTGAWGSGGEQRCGEASLTAARISKLLSQEPPPRECQALRSSSTIAVGRRAERFFPKFLAKFCKTRY